MPASESPSQELPVAAHPSTSNTAIAATVPTPVPTDAAPSKSNPAAPTAYKIVKVRKKPDGAIVKVRRPLEPGEKPKSTSATSSHSSARATDVKKTETTADKHGVTKAPLTKITQSKESESEQPASDVKSKTSQSNDLEPHDQVVKPKASKKDTKRSTATRTYRLFGGIHRIGRNLEHVAGAFDPDEDLGDDADDNSSDSFSDSSSSSEDDANHHKYANRRKQNTASKCDNDNDSVYSWQEGDSEYHESDNEDTKTQRQATAPTTDHPTSKEESYVAENVLSPAKKHEGKTTDTTSVKQNPGVEVNEKEVTGESDSVSKDAKRRPYRRLTNRLTFSQITVWAIMLTFPIFFIVLAAETLHLSGISMDSTKSTALQEAIKVAVTTWPIVFAAIITQSLKQFAAYKVERGVRLMELEQLLSSHSVSGAIKQPFFLQRIDWIGFGLLILWSISPLTSQALLRMSVPGLVSYHQNYTVPYIDTTGKNFVFTGDPSDIYLYSEVMNGLYTSSIMAPLSVQISPIDTWNNTKIPLIEVAIIEGYDTLVDDWYWVDAGSVAEYSSLLGIPMQIPNYIFGNSSASESSYSNFTTVLQTAYLTLTGCTPHQILTKDAIQQKINQSGTFMSENPSTTLLMSLKLNGNASNPVLHTYTQQLPGTLTFSSLTNSSSFDYLAGPPGLWNYSYTSCTLGQAFVDSQVICDYDAVGTTYDTWYCYVTAMRASKNATAYSPLSLSGQPGMPAADPIFIDSFVNASGIDQLGLPTLTERYISDPDFVKTSANHVVNITSIDIPDFEQRLALLMNTFWQAGFGYYSQVTGKVNSSNAGIETMPGAKFATVVYNDYHGAFVSSAPWVGIVLASSAITLLAGIASIYFDARTVGPNILGFASSLTRNNKYMDIPKQYSTLSGAEQARRLKHVKVMLQDVKPGSPVGKIALGTVSPGASKLTPGRLYK